MKNTTQIANIALVTILLLIGASGVASAQVNANRSEEQDRGQMSAPRQGSSRNGEDRPRGPAPCSSQADCDAEGACPPDAALGCICTETPKGSSACIPSCQTDDDCPNPPGMTLSCDQDKQICIPAGNNQRRRPDKDQRRK